MPYSDTTFLPPSLVTITGDAGGDADDAVLNALEAAAQEIDEAFSVAGYSTPLDLTLVANTDARTRLTARIRFAEQAIAGRLLSNAVAPLTGLNKATATKIAKDYHEARAWLAGVATRGVPALGLPRPSGASVGVVGTEKWDYRTIHDLSQLPDC